MIGPPKLVLCPVFVVYRARKLQAQFYMREAQYFDCTAGKMELKNQYFDPANTIFFLQLSSGMDQ